MSPAKIKLISLLWLLGSILPVGAQIPGRTSVLCQGDWHGFTTSTEGIYRITYAELQAKSIDPSLVRLYGSEAHALPETAQANDPVDLQEIPVWHYGNAIFFYGQGTTTWSINSPDGTPEHAIHPYAREIHYFITNGAGAKSIQPMETPNRQADTVIRTFDSWLVHERDLYNLLASGRRWAGEYFSPVMPTLSFQFSTQNVDMSAPASAEVCFLNRSVTNVRLELTHNGVLSGTAGLPVVSGSTNSKYVSEGNFFFNMDITQEPVSIELTYNSMGDSGANGWLDYIRLHTRQYLRMGNGPLFFRDVSSVGNQRITQFEISQASSNTVVWDITDPFNVLSARTTVSGSKILFDAATDHLRQFVAFNPQQVSLSPQWLPDNGSGILAQNLLGTPPVDMVIITQPIFAAQAERLALFHRTEDDMEVLVVTQQAVFNQFSGGKPDPAAIRNFMKYLSTTHPERKPLYLLLFGDGSYDYRSLLTSSATTDDPNIITYQSENSFTPLSTYTCDDYFGVIENGEELENSTLDIAVGRIPVKTEPEARGVVDKIVSYAASQGPWRQNLVLIADDEDFNEHLRQSEIVAGDIAQNFPFYTLQKVYLDAFPQQNTINGHRYPDAKERINNLLDKGVLMVNYLGHGNENGLTEERVIYKSDIEQWTNPRYPLFVVATCEFGRYDNPLTTTSGESVLLNPHGGGIAILTTTRLAYSNLNFELVREFYRNALTLTDDNDKQRIGDILKRTKNRIGTTPNTLCFALFGDPALRLAIPGLEVQTDKINQRTVSEQADTLKALQKVFIEGHIGSTGVVQSDFNGNFSYMLFDKPVLQTTLSNDGTSLPVSFPSQSQPLVQGTGTVTAGRFGFECTLPLDLASSYGFGKISYYAWSGKKDAGGAYTNIVTGGSSFTAPRDTLGPEIDLYLNHPGFRNGGLSHEKPLLVVHLKDEQGINLGSGLGHDMKAILNDNPEQTYILNSYFSSTSTDGTEGTIQFRFPELAPGYYSLSFSAWDIYNNPSNVTLQFRVIRSTTPILQNISNYPNPFTQNTRFVFDHNQIAQGGQVRIDIYDPMGRTIRTLQSALPGISGTGELMEWDGTDGSGKKISSGIYIYRITLRSLTGTTISGSSKMILIKE